ncbi:GNAT family N-acetyltransferase [Halobacillus faecis]|uniref:Putative ribosomal-protein-alanine acetyltransferase n=1 Tax=Halobacillus faecis TaxID=360184 RepID=A0A511WTU2_9BACI|nr:GNAT family protein [Halobacillus faecis]GEN52722.1 putative ribosomal-protein-alanine acetyltransferase [Halobacillus faecis]
MINGESIYIREFTRHDADQLLHYEKKNRSFFEHFSMMRIDDFYTLEGQNKRLETLHKEKEGDNGYFFGIFQKGTDQLIGTVNLFQVHRGSLQSAFIGYFLDQDFNGRGYTTEAVRLLVAYAFKHLQLHRIEAGVMPHNIASIRVLEKVGFHKEGIAKKNVKINGRWEDHQVLAIINPEDA